MEDDGGISLLALVPKLRVSDPKELASRPEIKDLTNTDPTIYKHQERARRATLGANAALFIHDAGLGKTLAMILSVESRRDSAGPQSKVYVITKKSISGFTKDDILSQFDRRNVPRQTVLSYYEFYTYQTFNDIFGAMPNDDLERIFAGATFVIDEFHSVYSYLRRPVLNGSSESHRLKMHEWLSKNVSNGQFVSFDISNETKTPVWTTVKGTIEIVTQAQTLEKQYILNPSGAPFGRSKYVYKNIRAYSEDGTPTSSLTYRSLYETLIVLRNLLPTNLIIAMSATPMMNSAYEISYAANVLLTREQLISVIPDAPDHLGEISTIIDTEVDYLRSEDELPEDLQRFVNTGSYWLYTEAIVKYVPILFKAVNNTSKATLIGETFDLSSGMALILGTRVTDKTLTYDMTMDFERDCMLSTSESGTTYTRKILLMGDQQRDNYVSNFSRKDFYRKARENSICFAEGLRNATIRSVEDIKPYSATLAYWIDIDIQAVNFGHWGVTAWYFDDLVSEGARIMADLYVALGWRRWHPDIDDARVPTVLLLTGDETLTAEMRSQLFSKDNIKGYRIRTIIYTKAVRDGVSFPNVFRGGSVPSWSLSGQIQADARRHRINSFDLLDPYLKNKDPEFMHYNSVYIRDGMIAPLTFDVLAVPVDRPGWEPDEDNPLTQLAPHYSIDGHMLNIRTVKGNEIQPVMDKLIANSIDELVKVKTAEDLTFIDHSNYVTNYMFNEMNCAFSAMSPATESEPYSCMSVAHLSIPMSLKKYFASMRFYAPKGREVEGPIGGNGEFLWGIGSMGNGPAPISKRLLAANNYGDVEKMNIFNYICPTTDERASVRNDLILGAFDVIAEYIFNRWPTTVGFRPELINYMELSRLTGSGPFLLLAIYAKMWSFGGSQKGELYFGLNLLSTLFEADAAEFARIHKWESVPTMIYKNTPTGVVKEFNAAVSWIQKRDPATGRWTDPLSIHFQIQNHAIENDWSFVAITHKFTARQCIQKGLPGYARTVAKVGNRGVGSGNGERTTSTTKLPNVNFMAALNYDERVSINNPPNSFIVNPLATSYFMSVQGVSYIPLVYKFISIPEINGKRPILEKTNVVLGDNMTTANNFQTEAQAYIPWATEMLMRRLNNPWIPSS
jgi:hypothetical protein